jgi:hypothetical protein
MIAVETTEMGRAGGGGEIDAVLLTPPLPQAESRARGLNARAV